MDLNHVSVFVRVVELESFTAAAGQLGLPKSSVSRTVTRLEEDLGVRLLQRTTRKLHLTEAGQAYYERARLALGGLEEAA
ncbi:MAG TPA: LysR family transcriptional regulator, partial [Polyangiaceae bacterium]